LKRCTISSRTACALCAPPPAVRAPPPLPEGVEPLRKVLAAAVHICAKLAGRVFDESDLFECSPAKALPVLATAARSRRDVVEQRDHAAQRLRVARLRARRSPARVRLRIILNICR